MRVAAREALPSPPEPRKRRLRYGERVTTHRSRPQRLFPDMHRYAPHRSTVLVVLAIVALVMTMAPPASAVTLTVVAQADAFVLSSSPNGNRGRTNSLKIRNDVKTSYVRFSVPDLPLGEAVSTATLRMFATTPSRCALGVDVFRAASDVWGESTITWANQPGATGTVLANATWTSNGYRSFDVTSAVVPGSPVTFVLRHASGATSRRTQPSRVGKRRTNRNSSWRLPAARWPPATTAQTTMGTATPISLPTPAAQTPLIRTRPT